MPQITLLGWLGIIILFNGTLIGGTNYLSDLFLSAAVVKALVAFASLGNMFLGGLVTMFSGQSTQIKNVASIQGIDGKPAIRVAVNANAPPAVASIALDPAQQNVGAATPEVRAALVKTAS